MVAVIAVILSLLGLFGTWPLFTKGFWAKITFYSLGTNLHNALNARIGAYNAPDGWVLIIMTIVLAAMMFMVTTPLLLRIRRIIIGLAWLFFASELIAALSNGHVALQNFSGLLFTFVMLSIAFAFSFTQWGSKSALVSSLQGQPTSEINVATQTITQIVKDATELFQWDIQISEDSTSPAKKMEFSGTNTLKVGRNPKWANLVIDNEKKYISRKHALFTSQPNGIVIRFVDAKYSMLVNGKLYKPSDRMFLENSFDLDVELVAGWGPRLKIKASPFNRSVLHPKALASVSNQVLKRYKNARTQIKAAMALILVAILGMGNISMMSTAKVRALFEAEQIKIMHLNKNIKTKQKELTQIKHKVNNLNQSIQQLQNDLQAKQARLRELGGHNRQLQAQINYLRDSLRTEQEKLRQRSAEAARQKEEWIKTWQDIILGESVFMGIVPGENGKGVLGTVWLGRYKNRYFLITADHVVFPEDHEKNVDFQPNDYIYLVRKYQEGIPDTTSTDENIQIKRAKFHRFKDRDICIFPINDVGIYATFAIPINPSIVDEVVTNTESVSWVGFPAGHYSSGKIGYCTSYDDTCIECNIATFNGASGGPLFTISPSDSINAFAVVSGISIRQNLSSRFSLLKEYMFEASHE